MAAESNGKAVDPAGKGINGQAVIPRSRRTKAKKSSLGSLFNTAIWLFTWYSIVTVIFRCPQAADLTDSSPQICKPYYQIQLIITPHVQPYYDTYAAPYVAAAKPYYDALDKRVITPATVYSKKYGAPRVAQAQAFGQAQWEKSVQPQVSKLGSIAQDQYTSTLAPHVNKVLDATSPYYVLVKNNALQTYYASILPTYNAVRPYAQHAYTVGETFTVQTGIPYSKWAWATGAVFLERTVWPKVRILYGESVEPQLVRIGERLGRYRDGKKLQASVDEIDKSSIASSATRTLSSIASSVSAAHATGTNSNPAAIVSPDSSASETTPAETPLSEAEIIAKAQITVQADLKNLQEKFAKAADEGSDELEVRITEITDRFVNKQAKGVGAALLIQLEETIKSELKGLKTSIRSIVKKSSDSNDESAEEALNTAVRKAGVAIKDRAQAIRVWRQNYDRETDSLVSKAAEDTFTIIDHIRDLGLQEIGMRWAWLDGVTHKDWTKYHAMKTKFDDWRKDVEEVATAHPGLEKARAASDDVQSQAMEIATDAAKELGRIKETGRWKLSTGDSSDDFSIKNMPAAAVLAKQKIVEKISDASEAIAGTTQGTVEYLSSVATSSAIEVVSSASSIAASLSSSILGTPQGSAESAISVVKASVGSVADHASSAIVGTSQGTVESVASVLSSSASTIAERASSSASSVATGLSSSISSVASSASDATLVNSASSLLSSGGKKVSKSVSRASSSLNSVASSASSVASKSVGSAVSEANSSASTASSAASTKVWGGALAQFVEARQIVLEDVVEDDDTYSEKIASMASEAGDRFSEITKAVSEALSKPTSTQGNLESITSLASGQWASAYSAASVAMYGTVQGTGESIASVASSRYTDAVKAASAAIYGIPTPVIQAFALQASSSYSEALSRASDHYSQAMSVISAQISGTPAPVHEQMLASVNSAYSDSVNAASSRLQAAVAAVSTAAYGPPQGAYESISSVAASKLSEGLSLASAQYESAKTYVGATPTPRSQQYLAQAQNQYYAGIGLAHARYSEFMSAASSAILPSQTPFHEGLYNRASASIVGTSTGAIESAVSAAASRYSDTVSSASISLDEALKKVIGKKDMGNDAGISDAALSHYSAAVSAASHSLASASKAASEAAYGTQTGTFESVSSAISENVKAAGSQVSTAVYGSETAWTESVASAASENWESLITKASLQIYGQPTPFHQSLYSQAGEYAAQATDGAAAQYVAIQSLINELVSGKEPDFTESVYNRFSSAYYTGAGAAISSASSVASEVYASASSVVTSVFTPPPSLEAILDSASSQVNAAVEAASVQFYGSSTGYYEAATSSAASAYSSASKAASVKAYGTPVGYAEAAQSSVADAVFSAQKAISEAIYGSSTPIVESATSYVVDTYSSASSVIAENAASVTSVAGENYAAASAKISSMIYGPEQSALESAQSRLSGAVESARVKLAEFAATAGEGASDAIKKASEGVDEFASSISSAVNAATSRVKDEL